MDRLQIELAVQITRRKFVNIAREPGGKVLFLSRSLPQVLDWMAENEIYEAEVISGERRWLIELSPLPR